MSPRPSPARSVYGENNAAQRIRMERTARGWTYEMLSRRMADAGCPILVTGLHKIENPSGGKPRRITLDEAIAFARVFDISTDELAVDPELAHSPQAVSLIERIWRIDLRLAQYRDLSDALWTERATAASELGDILLEHEGARAVVNEWLAAALLDQNPWLVEQGVTLDELASKDLTSSIVAAAEARRRPRAKPKTTARKAVKR